MARFYGPIGFITPVEVPAGSGIWIEQATERNYRGEVSRNTKRWDNGDQLNKNLNISNTISIVADPFISDHLYQIRYIKWLGSYWEINSIDVESPRLVLSIGGVYNGPTVGTTDEIGEHPRIS